MLREIYKGLPVTLKYFFIAFKSKTIQFFKMLVLKERSPHKLALSFAIGNYIAFCPFIGLHTAMIFLFAWIFKLNTAVTFATGYVVNNVFTAVPIFLSDYVFGYWLLHGVFHLKTHDINPTWMNIINDFLHTKLGIPNACFWSFMIGGNLLAIIVALVSYPLVKPLFVHLSRQMHKSEQNKENS